MPDGRRLASQRGQAEADGEAQNGAFQRFPETQEPDQRRTWADEDEPEDGDGPGRRWRLEP